MRRVTQKLLNKALKEATVHYQGEDTYIEYDSAGFYLFGSCLSCSAFDVDDEEVQLTEEQQTIVYNFIKDLQDTEQERQTELENQF